MVCRALADLVCCWFVERLGEGSSGEAGVCELGLWVLHGAAVADEGVHREDIPSRGRAIRRPGVPQGSVWLVAAGPHDGQRG